MSSALTVPRGTFTPRGVVGVTPGGGTESKESGPLTTATGELDSLVGRKIRTHGFDFLVVDRGEVTHL